MKVSDLKPIKPFATADDFPTPKILTIRRAGEAKVRNFETKKDEFHPALFIDGFYPIKVTPQLKARLLEEFGDVELSGLRVTVSRFQNKFKNWQITVSAAPPEETPKDAPTKEGLVAIFDALDAPADVPVDEREAWYTNLVRLLNVANSLRKAANEPALVVAESKSKTYDALKAYVDIVRASIVPTPPPGTVPLMKEAEAVAPESPDGDYAGEDETPSEEQPA